MIAVLALLSTLLPACYPPSVAAPVSDPFRAPACTYCPGNRGLEYRPPPGSLIRAVAGGVVRFDGVIAGVRWLVVEQDDGRVASYGYLGAVTVAGGQPVHAGQVVAGSTGRFYFGLRQGRAYIDPQPLIGVWRYRPRLIPTDGSAPRPPPPPTISCASAGGRR
jgi:murein DD-endopeptidase MepM/ murein hydrolase activator NlpD